MPTCCRPCPHPCPSPEGEGKQRSDRALMFLSTIFLSTPLRALRLCARICRACARIIDPRAKSGPKRAKSCHTCRFPAENRMSGRACKSAKRRQYGANQRQRSAKSARFGTIEQCVSKVSCRRWSADRTRDVSNVRQGLAAIAHKPEAWLVNEHFPRSLALRAFMELRQRILPHSSSTISCVIVPAILNWFDPRLTDRPRPILVCRGKGAHLCLVS